MRLLVKSTSKLVEAQARGRPAKCAENAIWSCSVDRGDGRDAVVVGVGGVLAELTGTEIVGSDSGALNVVTCADVVKKPVLRKLSVTCRPSSTPASSVCVTAPVCSENDQVGLVEQVLRAGRVVVGRDRHGRDRRVDRAREHVLVELVVVAVARCGCAA